MTMTGSNWRSGAPFVAFTVAFAMMTDSITYDMVVPFLPALFAGRLKVPEDQVASWLSLSLEAFGVAMLITNYIAGYMFDKIASKSKPFMVGLGALFASTLLFFISTTPTLIITSRVLQGVSCALVWTSGLAFLTATIDERDVGYYTGYALMGATIGELIGPLLGGLVYENFGHWTLFIIVEAVVFLDVILRLFVRDSSNENKPESCEEPGSEHHRQNARMNHETDPLLDNAQHDTSHGESFPDCREQKPDILNRVRILWIAQLTAMLAMAAVRCALETAIPLTVSNFFGWSSDAAGGVMFALLLPTLLSPWAGRLAGSRGPGLLCIAACTISSGALICIGCIIRYEFAHSRVGFVLLTAVIGVCNTVTTSATTTGILTLTKKLEVLPSSGTQWPTEGTIVTGLSTAWALGMIAGPACASLFEYTDPDGWTRLCLLLTAMCCFSLLCSIVIHKKWWHVGQAKLAQ